MNIIRVPERSAETYLGLTALLLAGVTGYLIFQFDVKAALAILAIPLIFFASRSVRILTFLCIATLWANQTHFWGIRDILSQVRWGMLSLFAVTALLRSALSHKIRHFYKFDVVILIFVIYAFLSGFYSVAPFLTLERSVTLILLYIAIFRVLWSYAESEDKIIEIIDLILKAAVVLYSACFISAGLTSTAFELNRFRGIMENPNSLGILTSMLFPLVVWRAHSTRKKKYFGLAGGMFIALVMTACRSGLLCSALGVGYFLFYAYERKRLHILVGAVLLASLAMMLPNRHYDVREFEQHYRFNTLDTGSGRTEAWRAAIDLIKERPFLGYGFGTEDRLFGKYDFTFKQHEGKYIHNSYLGLTAQSGLLGSFMFFIPLFYLFWKCFAGGDKNNMLQNALLGVLIAGLVEAFFESWIYSVGNSQSFPFWISVMLLMRLNYLKSVNVKSVRRMRIRI